MLLQESKLFTDATGANFLQLKAASVLEAFIHARKFKRKTFSKSKWVQPEK